MTKDVTLRSIINPACTLFRGVDGALYLMGKREVLTDVVGKSGLAVNNVSGQPDEIGCIKIRLPEAEAATPATEEEPKQYHYLVHYACSDGTPRDQWQDAIDITLDKPWDADAFEQVEIEIQGQYLQEVWVKILNFTEFDAAPEG